MRSHIILYYTLDHKVPRRELGTAIRVARSFTIFPKRTESNLSECQNDNRDQPSASENRKTYTSLGGRRATEPGGGGLLKVASSGDDVTRPIDACALHAHRSPLASSAGFSRPFIQDVSFSLYFRLRDELVFMRDVTCFVKNV